MADPTITDVFNQLILVNGKLDQVNLNTTLIADLNASINSGFNDTVNALNVLTQVNIEAARLLYHQTRQGDTMICALEHISRNTCEILTQVTVQTALQVRLGEDVDALRYIAESVHPEAAVEGHRHAELQAKIERCCPPEQSKPACNYRPCDKPEPAKEPELPRLSDNHIQ